MWAVICLQQGLAFRTDRVRLENGVVGRRASEAELDCLWAIAQLENGVKLTLAASVPPAEPTRANGSSTELPTDLELLQGVHQHLLVQARSLAAAGEEHSGYLSRVAASAIAIVARGLEDRASVLAHEKA